MEIQKIRCEKGSNLRISRLSHMQAAEEESQDAKT